MGADCVVRLAAKKMCSFGWVSMPPSSLTAILSVDCVGSGVSVDVRAGVG